LVVNSSIPDCCAILSRVLFTFLQLFNRCLMFSLLPLGSWSFLSTQLIV
jgi:hypothetical protein